MTDVLTMHPPAELDVASLGADGVRVNAARASGPALIVHRAVPDLPAALVGPIERDEADIVVAVQDGVVSAAAFSPTATRRLERRPDRLGLLARSPAAFESLGMRVHTVAVPGRAPLLDRCFARWARAAMRRGGRDSAPPRPFVEADRELATTLDSLDEATNYRDWIIELVADHLHGSILEIGAGHGSLTERLVEFGPVTANDLSERCLSVLHERFDGDSRVRVAGGDVDAALGGEQFDTVVLVNVLEHIADDLGALRRLHDRLRPGGTLIVWVPAFEELYSSMDEAIGHHRRYRRGALLSLATRAGFEVVEARYVNPIGMLAWYVIATRLGLIPTTKGRIDLFDRAVVPVMRAIERHWRAPLGQSVLLIGRRRG